MRISSKGRYGLAAMISMAEDARLDENVTILSISEKLGISKIYLEQVFSLLKRADLVTSVKGAQGGYRLAAAPVSITAGQILKAVEAGLFEKTEHSLSEGSAPIEQAMETLVWEKLDSAVAAALDGATLADLAAETRARRQQSDYMFYI